ncbi:MAG: hypothetical protein RXR01_09915 [Thermoproteus sp.]
MPVQADRWKTANVFSSGPLVGAVPAVAVNAGQRGRLIMIRAPMLSSQLNNLMAAGIRRVGLLLLVDGQLLSSRASIVSRGPAQPPWLHLLGEAERFLADIYARRREAMGTKRNAVPVLILSLMPLSEEGSTAVDKQERRGGP